MNVIQDAPQHIQQKQQVSIIMINKTSMNNHAPKDVPKTFQDLKNSLEKYFLNSIDFSNFLFRLKGRIPWILDYPLHIDPSGQMTNRLY